MPTLGPTELIIIGVVLVLLFGATRLPQTAKGLGQALKIFKKEVRDEDRPAQPEVQATPQTTAQPAPTQQPAAQTQAPAAGTPAAAPTQSAQDADSTSR